MSKNYALKAAKREQAGKGVARALRREGKTPAVIYGDKKEPINVALVSNDINVEYLKGHMYTNLCDMDVDGETHLVLARDVQLHPVTDNVVHADFLRVTEKTKIAVNVPVHTINESESPGLRDGGVLNIVAHEIELMCTATAIPEFVEADLSGMEQGDSIKIDAIALPEGTTPINEDPDFTIVTVQAPKKIEEPIVEEVEGEEGELAEGEEGAEGAEGEGGEPKAEGEGGGDDAKKDE